MNKLFSSIVVSAAIFAAVFFCGRQCAVWTNSPVAIAASPVTLQGLEGYYLKKGGNPAWTRKLNGLISTDIEGEYEAGMSIEVYDKRGSRTANLITIVEIESKEQHPGKGKFCTVYAGTITRTKSGSITGGSGTYYNNDGESGRFQLTRTP